MLYFVSTPIGNLLDISYRAIEVLKSVDVIACEDTRHSLPLLNKYEIKKPLISYQKFNEVSSSQKIIDLLLDGKSVAVISHDNEADSKAEHGIGYAGIGIDAHPFVGNQKRVVRGTYKVDD